jgi:plasmid stability protein
MIVKGSVGWPDGLLVDMCKACKYALHMSKMIQIRNVPDALHRTLKARAALAGMALSDYLLLEMREIADRPTLAELRERLHTRAPVTLPIDTAQLIRDERDAR